MRLLRPVLVITVLAVLVTAVYGWWRTTPEATSVPTASRGGTSAQGLQADVDSSALDTARKLLPLAITPEEQRLAASAAEKADHLLDLNFETALREATEHPPAPTPAIRAAQARLDAAAQQIIADNLKVAQLGAAAAKARSDRNNPLEGELALAQAQFEVDQYELTAAGAELAAVGGDTRARIEALVAAHKAAAPPSTATKPVAALPQSDLIHLLKGWLTLRRTDHALAAALAQAQAALEDLARERERLRQVVHPRAPAPAAAGSASVDAGAPRPPEIAASLLESTHQVAAAQQALASVDSRAGTERELLATYGEWRGILAKQITAIQHRTLLGIAIIAGTCLVLLFFGRWLAAAYGRLGLDRRQVSTLRTVSTVVLQVTAVLVIAIVIVGLPNQLGVFLGLAGAGLTVALKDFIVAFLGWLVLMGKNGVRLGDWVEINGVAGEVVELGIFHTVLLETGNWTDSGHPTGRRVTFTNSFAIEGHYFNFSTTGQWMWDELQVVVPTGQDLYAFVGEITQAVKDATAKNASEAEEEWRRAAPAHQLKGFSAAPAINVRPVIGGTEISLRYIAHANERYRLRATLYQAAVDLLRPKPAAPPAA